MKLAGWAVCLGIACGAALSGAPPALAQAKRIVIVKVDGLPEDLLERDIDQLPWIRRVFVERGAWMRNFYVRGISLSAPSWSMLDTGQHQVIRGNADFDRLMPHVYDYLNFFPFYVNYARSRRVDSTGVEVLDEAGIPLFSDSFPPGQRYQSMQIYQRGIRWETLAGTLREKLARPVKDLIDEWQTGLDMSAGIEQQQERELIAALANPKVAYLDYYTGDVDHTMHLTNDPASQLIVLKQIDATVGRIWAAIEASPLAGSTVMVMVSDHGMNSTPDVYSQGYNLVHFFNSAAGGGHHVISTRHPMSEFKLRGLDPFVSAVVTPSAESLYLRDQKDWATALLDLDGNERTSVQLRNSDLNEIQILMQQLERKDLPVSRRNAIAKAVVGIIDRHRTEWSQTVRELYEELPALSRAIERERALLTAGDKRGESKSVDARRGVSILETWEKDERGYAEYARALQKMLDVEPAELATGRIPFAVPKGVLGDSNSIEQLANYAVGLAADVPAIDEGGAVDPDRSFVRVNYFEALANIRVRNVVQKELGAKPVDFIAARSKDGVYLYGDAQHGALILSRVQDGQLWLKYLPVCDLQFKPAEWGPGFPLHLFEDPELRVAGDRKQWLSEWHPEKEWFEAIHRTRYSNAAIGLEEYFAPWEPDGVPAVFRVADRQDWPLLRRFAARLRAVVQPDMLILAEDHWNFNVKSFNPGGNHGSFFRISTHSVFMATGAGIPAGIRVEEPYDSLSFVPTLAALMGKSTAGTYPGQVVGELLQKR